MALSSEITRHWPADYLDQLAKMTDPRDQFMTEFNPKVKTFEDDPTVFGQVLQEKILVSRIDEMRFGNDALSDRIRQSSERMRREVADHMPRCAKCSNFMLEVIPTQDLISDTTTHILRTKCKGAPSGSTNVCPDGELAVKRGFRAVSHSRLHTGPLLADNTMPLLSTWHESMPVKTNIRTSPDTPMTASEDAW